MKYICFAHRANLRNVDILMISETKLTVTQFQFTVLGFLLDSVVGRVFHFLKKIKSWKGKCRYYFKACSLVSKLFVESSKNNPKSCADSLRQNKPMSMDKKLNYNELLGRMREYKIFRIWRVSFINWMMV